MHSKLEESQSATEQEKTNIKIKNDKLKGEQSAEVTC